MPVKFDQSVHIDAPPDKVWALMSDATTWPLWFPEVEQVSNFGSVQTGGTFQFQHGGDTGTGVITKFDPQADVLVVVTQEAGGMQVTHTFDIDRSGGFLGLGSNDSKLRYTMEYDPPGGMIGDFIAGGNPMDTMKVRNTLNKVKGLAEGR
jgi:uncharacterized protein YndB with AHSA1/START domain